MRGIPLLGVVLYWCALSLSTVEAADPLPSGSAPDSSDTGSPTTPADPLKRYLDSLSRQTDGSFSPTLMQDLAIPAAVIDSLARIVQHTGKPISPASQTGWHRELTLGGLRYNRVEGLNVMPRVGLRALGPPRLQGSLIAGYGTSSEIFTWRADLRAALRRGSGGPVISARCRRDVEAYGSGIAPGNSLFALLVGQDDGDYELVEGWSAGLEVAPGPVRCGLSYHAEDQSSLGRKASLTLLKGKQRFRQNLPIDEGMARFVQLSISPRIAGEMSTRWKIDLIRSGAWLGGEFEYQSLRASIGKAKAVWFGDLIRANLSGGTIIGRPPFQALHYLGGWQALRGYQPNEFAARRFAHLGIDYELGTDLLGGIPRMGLPPVQLVPFFDAAAIMEGQDRAGTRTRHHPALWRFSAGIGLQQNLLGLPVHAGQVRFDIARRLDRSHNTLTFRLGITPGL